MKKGLFQKKHTQKKVNIILFNIYFKIAIITNKIISELEKNKMMYLNLYEITIDSSLIEDETLIETFLFECQCAIFLVDITKEDSFKLIKDLLKAIKFEKFPYLKKILVQNKLDVESTRKVPSFEIKEFLDSIQGLDNQEISLKNGENVQELIKKINHFVNETKNELPTNVVSEALGKNKNLMNVGALSFILIGDSTVGKTCFLTRYFKNQFNETFLSTIGIDKEIKYVKVKNDTYKMTLWDTAGQDRFKSLPKKYYQNADGVLLLFDVTSEDTFNNVSNWMKDVKENSNKNINSENGQSEIALYLIGNKIDLPNRVISKEQAETEAKSLGMKYFEISCKTNMNIPEVMNRMIMECHMRANNIRNLKLEDDGPAPDDSGCCGNKKKKKKK